jgi:alpha-glucosidase (family GH31 glycosyl hydrolase)
LPRVRRVLSILAVALVTPQAAAAQQLDAGSLRARVAHNPWGITFVDRAGRTVLAEAPAGTLGFRTAAGSFHATRVVASRRAGRAWKARLATSDPLGRRLSVRLERDAEGAIALRARVTGPRLREVTHAGIAFRARPSERYLGFGERSNAVDQRGNEIENYVSEGPFEEDERGLVPAFVPAWGYHPRDDATYFPMPWLLSTAGYGVLLDNSEPSTFDLDRDARGRWRTEVEAAQLRLRVFAGPRPADVLRRLTARIGRQPSPPAAFVFGPWYQPRDDEEEILAGLQRGDVPVSVAQTYTHYLPCQSQRGRRDAERARVERFHRAGLAVTTYFNPMICTGHTRYPAAAAANALVRNDAGVPYVYRYSTTTPFVVSQFDFSAEPGRDFYGSLLREAIADGHDGWMEDFGEYTPLDSRSASGLDGHRLHNLYPTQYHCGARRAAPEAARFVRSGWTGTGACAPIVWGGDPSVDWGFDGLESAITNGLTMGLSGVSTWGSDIGGFFALLENRLTPELLVRWIQFGAVSGVMRTQANGIHIPESERPQLWDPGVVAHWRRWAKLRTQLYPYLVAADAEYRRTGLPIMRHLSLAYPRDRSAMAEDDAFLFGPDLLAVPVVRPGARRRQLYLPAGRWVDLWRSASYVKRSGGLALRGARVLRGGRSVSVPAPLDELPLLARVGTLLPLLSPDVDTLASYGNRARVVSLSERWQRRVLLAFPRGGSRARLGDGGELRSRERSGGWELSIRSRKKRRWDIQASLATLERPFRPCRVKARGGRVDRWRFDRGSRVLRAAFTTRRGRLTVSACSARRL